MTAERDAIGGDRQRRPEQAAARGEREDRGRLPGGSTLRRAGAAVLGVVLLVRGLRRGRSLRGVATALAGGWLLSRAIRGTGGGAAEGRGRRGGTGLRSLLQPAREELGASRNATEISRSVTVDVPAEDLHDYWREPEQLSQIMGHFAEVESGEGGRLRWTVPGPGGMELGWESRLTVDQPGEILRWETLPGADVPNEGAVEFRPAPGDRGTEVQMTVRFDPPGGPLGRAALSVLGVVPRTIVATSMRRFKSLAETGEIPTLEGNPSGRGQGDRA